MPTAYSVVSSARTTSSSFMRCTGLKKCMPTTWPARVVAAAISVIESEDVFDARIASRGAMRSSFANVSTLRSIFSGTASITSCDPAAAASNSRVVLSRSFAAAAASGVTLPAATPLSSVSSMFVFARSSASALTSCSTVSNPPSADMYAMPRPMMPAPRMPMVLIVMESPCSPELRIRTGPGPPHATPTETRVPRAPT